MDKELFAIKCLFDYNIAVNHIQFRLETNKVVEDICETLGKEKNFLNLKRKSWKL